jgi:hypothetical protein
MGRSRGQKTRDKNKTTLPQVPKQLKSDGLDVEYSKAKRAKNNILSQGSGLCCLYVFSPSNCKTSLYCL